MAKKDENLKKKRKKKKDLDTLYDIIFLIKLKLYLICIQNSLLALA